MIPRGLILWLFTFLIICPFFSTKAVSNVKSEKTYDTNDWIPITPAQRRDSRQSVANDRILDYHSSNQNFQNDKEYSRQKQTNNNLPHFVKKPSTTIYNENFKAEKINYPHSTKLKFETPPPPPTPNQPQVNYYNGKDITPYLFEQPPPPPSPQFETSIPIRSRKPAQAKHQKYQAASNEQFLNQQQPLIESYAGVPNVNPEVPPRITSTGYDQYQIPINSSFYESLNPSSINNDFYQAINNYNQLLPNVDVPKPVENTATQNSPNQEESVQLVYVPAENLKNKSPTPHSVQILPQPQLNKGEHSNNFKVNRLPQNYNYQNPVTQSSELIYKPENNEKFLQNKKQKLVNIEQDFIRQAIHAHNLQKQFQDEINPLYQETVSSTSRPISRNRAHQPPLAVFMESGEDVDVADVLDVLKTARSISVQDNVTPNSPKIFIGPSTLNSHPGYTKFALPYLNSVNGNRIERKIDQLPFFVAPASYRAPPGYAKIPLPSPHVGSLVASVPAAVPSVVTTLAPEPNHFSQNTLNPFSFSYPEYNFDYQNPRPVQNFVNNDNNNNNYRYQSTPIPPVSSTPFNGHPLQQQNIFRNPYDLPQLPDEISNIDKRPHEPVKQNIAILNTNDNKQDSITKDNSQEVTQENVNVTPFKQINVNPLDVSLNNYELSQINNQLLSSNKKVKHSTTRRPQTTYHQSDVASSSTLPPVSEYSSDRPVRGRVRGRGRGTARASTTPKTTTTSTSTTTASTTTTTTTTELPLESYFTPDDYLSDPTGGSPSTENYQQYTSNGQTDNPLRYSSPSPYDINPYLPLEQFGIGQTLTKLNNNDKAPIDDGIGGSVPPIDVAKPQVFDRHRQYFQENIQASTPSIYNFGQSTIQDDTTLRNIKGTESTAQSLYDNADLSKYVTPSNFPEQKASSKATDYNHNLDLDYPNSNGVHDVSKEANIKESLPTTVPEQAPIKKRKQPPTSTTPPLEEYTYNLNAASKETSEEAILKTTLPQNHYNEESSINDNINDNSHVYQTDSGQKPIPTDNSAKIAHNLFQPNFDQTYISLQDQAVRSLLSPIAPPAEQETIPTTPSYKAATASTNTLTETSAIRDIDTTTRVSSNRIRNRGRARQTTASPVTGASSPPRSSNRRRPTSTKVSSTTEQINSGEDFGRFVTNTRRRVVKPRPRQPHTDIPERISTSTENYAKTSKETELSENDFRGLNSREFDRSNEQQIVQSSPDSSAELKDYSDLYSLTKQPSANPTRQETIQRFGQEFQSINVSPSSVVNDPIHHNAGGVDESASYNVPVQTKSRPDILTKSDEISDQYVKYNTNIKSGHILNPNTPDSATKPTALRTRGRTRVRTRLPASTTSRPIIVTKVSTTPSALPSSTTEEQEEFYGFIRHPNYKSQSQVSQSTKSIEPKRIQFVGEIKPKYTISKSTAPSITEDSISTEPARQRVRSRTRAPTRKISSTYKQTDDDISNIDQNTKRTSTTATRSRGRGSAHYKRPDNVKRDNDDEDIADQNYPVNFLQLLDPTATPKLTPSSFQITVDPIEDEDNFDEEDQASHSSILVTKHLPAPEGWANPNELPSGNKPIAAPQETSAITMALPLQSTTKKSEVNIENIEALPIVKSISERTEEETTDVVTTTTTQDNKQSVSDENNKQKQRKKGVWKLVRHQPVDPLEGSESQSYHTVINSFDSLNKIDEKESLLNQEKPVPKNNEEQKEEPVNPEENDEDIELQETTTNNIVISQGSEQITTVTVKSQDTFFDTIYQMFGLLNKPDQTKGNKSKNETIDTNIKEAVIENGTEQVPSVTTNPDNDEFPETTQSILSTTAKKYEVEPWEMKAVKMLTSTEVTHETEICYKGRCIKSKEKKI